MWKQRLVVAMLATGLAVAAPACSDDAPNGTMQGVAGAGGTAAGSAGTAPVSGNGGAAASSAGSTSGGSSAAGQNTGGSGGMPGRVVVGARADLCSPGCPTNEFCALVDAGCGANAPCLLEAECRPLGGCSAADNFMCSGAPGNELACADDSTDDCVGAECPAVCYCGQTVACEGDLVFNEDPAVCHCVSRADRPMSCLDYDCPDGFECEAVMKSAACVRPATN